MLVLSRKIGESLVLDKTIEIKVIEISGDQVKIGIDAPKDCRILRKELIQTVLSNQQAAQIVAAEEVKKLLSKLKK